MSNTILSLMKVKTCQSFGATAMHEPSFGKMIQCDDGKCSIMHYVVSF